MAEAPDRACQVGSCIADGEEMRLLVPLDMRTCAIRVFACTHHRQLLMNAEMAPLIRLAMSSEPHADVAPPAGRPGPVAAHWPDNVARPVA